MKGIGAWVVVALVLALWIAVIVRVLRNRFTPIRTVDAVVVDKHTVESFSKYSGNGKSVRYYSIRTKEKSIVFMTFTAA